METVFLIVFFVGLVALVALIIWAAAAFFKKNTIDADFEELEQAQVSSVNYDIVEFHEPVVEIKEDVAPVKAKRKAAKKKAAKKSVKKVKKEKSDE